MIVHCVIALIFSLDKLFHNFITWGYFDLTTVRSYLLAHNLTPEDVGTSEEELMKIHLTNERRSGTDYSTFEKLSFKFKWMGCDLATVRMYLLAHNLKPEDVGTSEEELMSIHRTNEQRWNLNHAKLLVGDMRVGESSVRSVRDALSRYNLTPEDAGTTEAELVEIERARAIQYAKGQFLVIGRKHLPEVLAYLSYYNLVPEDIGTTRAHLEVQSRWCDQKFGREYLQYIREGNSGLIPGLRQFLLNRALAPEDVGTTEEELVKLERT